jgi:hypothetical protein
MRANVWTGVCAAIVSIASVGVFAQPPQQTATPQQPTTPPAAQATAPKAPPSSSEGQKITVTGCLKAAPQVAGDVTSAAPTGTAGSTTPAATGTAGTTDPSTAKFVLTGASTSPSDSTAESVTPQTYRLIANPTALTEHVGKKLELVGTLDTTSVADPKDPSAAAPALRVESGKIVAASCSQ